MRAGGDEAPARPGLVLGTLILVAAVANLNLSVANVALPDIGRDFDASQTELDLISVGFPWGWRRRCCGWVRWATATDGR